MKQNEIQKSSQLFFMLIENVELLLGNKCVVDGFVKYGQIHVGDEVDVVGFGGPIKTKCCGIRVSGVLADVVSVGVNAGIMLCNVQETDVHRGQVLAAPNSVVAYSKFVGRCHILAETEGGRKVVFQNKRRFMFGLNATFILGEMTLPAGKAEVCSGDTADVDIELLYPLVFQKGDEFDIRENGVILGTGMVIETK